MQRFTSPLRKDICDQVRPGLYEELISFNPKTLVLDLGAFRKALEFEPVIATIFVLTSGGSYNDEEIQTCNGTLVSLRGRYYYSESERYAEIMKILKNLE